MRMRSFITWSLGLILLGCQTLVQAKTLHYYYTDPQGTVLAKTDANGNVIARYDYAPYGNQALGNPPNGPGYTGHVNDPDTGLVYMQARYYDPEAHMLSPDPVGPTPGNLFGFNRYTYANNNPITNTDPTGMASDDDCSAACMFMRRLSDKFDGISHGQMDNAGRQGGSTAMGQLNYASNYISASGNEGVAIAAGAVAPVADLVPGATLAACTSGGSCSGSDWLLGGLAALPGEAVEVDAAKEAYPFVVAGVHGNSAASTVTSYLYRLTTKSGDLLKWGISKDPLRRYTQGYMQTKSMQIMTSGSRREMLNLERWTVEHDPGPLNRERWAGKQVGDVP